MTDSIYIISEDVKKELQLDDLMDINGYFTKGFLPKDIKKACRTRFVYKLKYEFYHLFKIINGRSI